MENLGSIFIRKRHYYCSGSEFVDDESDHFPWHHALSINRGGNVETIHIEHPHQYNRSDFPSLVLALGFFDGIHLGHQKVIGTAKEEASKRGWKSGVMTFDPHPKEVLRKGEQVDYLTPLKIKKAEIEKLNVDYLFVIHFTSSFAELTPQSFCDQYLIDLNVKHVVAGFDYTYGRLGKGTMETMPFHSRGEFTQTVVSKLNKKEEKISSTRVRNCIRQGDVTETCQLLGRSYETTGVVVKGDQRGRTIGFPTANVDKDSSYLLPKTGVYIVELEAADRWYHGMCNVGYKPTFHKKSDGDPTVEVHVFNFDGDLYGQTVKINWKKRIRDERPFSSVDDLIDQLNNDKVEALAYFEK